MIVSAVLALATQGAAVSDRWIERAVRKARPVAECRVGPDCEAKWARARRWISENSRFALARETDSLLITYGAVYANTDPSAAVVLDPPRNGVRTIRFRAWCGNVFACYPSPKTMRRLFTQAMRDTATPPGPDVAGP